jgi:Protein of unknown function (DUF2934)
MDQSTENRIRERAYEIWSANGFVHGQADQHWLRAEQEILAAPTAALTRKPPRKRSGGSPARSKTARMLALRVRRHLPRSGVTGTFLQRSMRHDSCEACLVDLAKDRNGAVGIGMKHEGGLISDWHLERQFGTRK